MKRKLNITVLLCLLLVVAACTGTMNLTPSAQYYAALSTWNDNLDTYTAAYNAASPATKAKWHKDIDPFILVANRALDTWRMSIGTADAATKYQGWQTAQREALALLVQVGIIKVQEGGK